MIIPALKSQHHTRSFPKNDGSTVTYPCAVFPLRAADHGAEVGEQEVDGVRVALFGLQPSCICPLPTLSVQRLSAEVVLLLAEVGALQDALAAVVCPTQQVGDVFVAPELGDIVGGL